MEKSACITYFQEGIKKRPENYRPVSLTCVVCKTMESLVRDKLMSHMESNRFFSEHQFGFRSGHSCATQLLCVLEDWSRALDCYENVDVIYLDFRKAFDTVPHARLINKLYAYGIRGNLLQWIQNFLTDRKQKVIVQGEESQWADVASDIPQGSVLGPVLFLIYINDLPDVVKKFVTIFADDTKEHAVIKSDVDTIEVQEDLYNMSDWSDIWEIKFNAKKCKSMHMGKSNPETVYYMKEGNQKIPLEQVTEEKDLGVTFCETLKFDKHILNCVNKRSFTYMDKKYVHAALQSVNQASY